MTLLYFTILPRVGDHWVILNGHTDDTLKTCLTVLRGLNRMHSITLDCQILSDGKLET
jgi:hypothetical protein